MITSMLSKSGKSIPNQFVITTKEGLYFQSYDSMIAFISHDKNTIKVTDKWNYSPTTLKYLKQFLGTSLTKEQIAKRIESKAIVLDNNLNLKV